MFMGDVSIVHTITQKQIAFPLQCIMSTVFYVMGLLISIDIATVCKSYY